MRMFVCVCYYITCAGIASSNTQSCTYYSNHNLHPVPIPLIRTHVLHHMSYIIMASITRKHYLDRVHLHGVYMTN